MHEIARRAVDEALRAGADYADARVQRVALEELTVQNDSLAGASATEDFGLGVRVLKDGAWGFAAAPGTHADLHEVAPGLARRAVKAGRDLRLLQRRHARTPRYATVAEVLAEEPGDRVEVVGRDAVDALLATD